MIMMNAQRYQEKRMTDNIDAAAHLLRQHVIDDIDPGYARCRAASRTSTQDHDAETAPCSSSQELEEMSKDFRTVGVERRKL